MSNKVSFVGFRRGDCPNDPLDPPLSKTFDSKSLIVKTFTRLQLFLFKYLTAT